MVVLHIETGDDNIETVTVARGYISDIEPSLLGCGVGGVEVDDAGVGTDTLAADIIVVAGGEGEVGGETHHHQDQPHHLSQSDSASQVSPPPEVDDDSWQLPSFPPEKLLVGRAWSGEASHWREIQISWRENKNVKNPVSLRT